MDQIIVVSENGKFKEHTTVQLKNSLTLGFDGDGNIVALRGAALYTDIKNNELYKTHILKELETWHHTIKPCGFKIPPELGDMMTIGILSGGLISEDEKVQSETKTECESTTGEMKPCTQEDTESCSPYQATVVGMLSPDYKERFKAEYQQTKIRYEKLKAFCNRIEAARHTMGSDSNKIEEPKHDCPFDLLRGQQRAMGEYLHYLEIRAVIEGIEL
jgi:hypothetical protein